MKITLFATLILLCFIGGYSCKSTNTGTVTPTPPVVSVDTVGKFKNPILPVGPDPWVAQRDGFYYVMHTTGNSIRIYKTRTMSRLSSARAVTVWTPPATGSNSRNIWAPELHSVNGKWYIYYTADDGVDRNHRMFVLENESADPTTGTWAERGQLNLPDNKWAIDGTLLNLNNQLYFAWSGWDNDLGGAQYIYLTRLINPYTVATGTRVRVSAPDYSWEKQGFGVNEGPEFLVNGGKVFLIYSASYCATDLYALGQLSADTTSNLLNAASWTKSPTPVFGPYASGSTYGVGHNGFFKSVSGTENWIIYHANPAPGQGCADFRSIRMQPFTFKADGSPDFGSPDPAATYIKRPAGE